MDDLTDDEEAEPETGRALVTLPERIEEIRKLVLWNRGAAVVHGDDDMLSLAARDGERDIAASVLDGVRKQVRQGLLEARLVPGSAQVAFGANGDPGGGVSGFDLVGNR